MSYTAANAGTGENTELFPVSITPVPFKFHPMWLHCVIKQIHPHLSQADRATWEGELLEAMSKSNHNTLLYGYRVLNSQILRAASIYTSKWDIGTEYINRVRKKLMHEDPLSWEALSSAGEKIAEAARIERDLSKTRHLTKDASRNDALANRRDVALAYARYNAVVFALYLADAMSKVGIYWPDLNALAVAHSSFTCATETEGLIKALNRGPVTDTSIGIDGLVQHLQTRTQEAEVQCWRMLADLVIVILKQPATRPTP